MLTEQEKQFVLQLRELGLSKDQQADSLMKFREDPTQFAPKTLEGQTTASTPAPETPKTGAFSEDKSAYSTLGGAFNETGKGMLRAIGGVASQAPRVLGNLAGAAIEYSPFTSSVFDLIPGVSEAKKQVAGTAKSLGETATKKASEAVGLSPTEKLIASTTTDLAASMVGPKVPPGLLGSGNVAKMATHGLEGLLDMSKYTLASRGEAPTATEAAIGGGAGALFGSYPALKSIFDKVGKPKIGAEEATNLALRAGTSKELEYLAPKAETALKEFAAKVNPEQITTFEAGKAALQPLKQAAAEEKNQVLDQIPELFKSPSIKAAVNGLKEIFSDVAGKEMLKIKNRIKVLDMQLKKFGGLSAKQADEVKQLHTKYNDLFSAGAPKAGFSKDVLRSLRSDIKNELEVAANRHGLDLKTPNDRYGNFSDLEQLFSESMKDIKRAAGNTIPVSMISKWVNKALALPGIQQVITQPASAVFRTLLGAARTGSDATSVSVQEAQKMLPELLRIIRGSQGISTEIQPGVVQKALENAPVQAPAALYNSTNK